VAKGESWEQRFKNAVEAVRNGPSMSSRLRWKRSPFEFKETKDPNHWMYFHRLLREDPFFRYPRNLYRQHGSRRSLDRISRHDQGQAKQMIDTLRGVIGSSQDNGGDDQ
jgi:hypothetical protein